MSTSTLRSKLCGVAVAFATCAATDAAEFRAGRAFVIASDPGSQAVVVAELSESGSLVRTFGGAFNLSVGTSLQFMSDGTLQVPCGAHGIAYVFDAKGVVVGSTALQSTSSGGSTLSETGELLFACPFDDKIVARNGNLTTTYFVAGYGADIPFDVEIDAFDRLVFSSFGTNRVVRVSLSDSSFETLGSDATTSDVTRIAITPVGDIFALRENVNTVAVIRADGVTLDTADIAAVSPRDIAIAPDGTVAVLSSTTDEIVHFDPVTLTVVERVAYPTNLFAIRLAFAPARFDVKVKGISVDASADDAPRKVALKGVRASVDLGTACVTLDVPDQYSTDGLVPVAVRGPMTFRLQTAMTAGASLPTSGVGFTRSGLLSMSTALSAKPGKGGVPQVVRLKGAFDFFHSIDQGHFEFTTTKRRK